jgi:NAD(P)-dependent dehydrogenase (short-subunit alcohol dehydrogenase family)
MSGALEGKVVALIGSGSEHDRAIAIVCAQAGANLALATTDRSQQQEFAMNSIANEAWALDRDQFVTVMDASDATAVIAFAEQTWDRYGRCDALIAAHHLPSAAPLDELSPDEWDYAIQVNLTAPFLAAHAFGKLMERSGTGLVIFAPRDLAGADAAYRAARAALEAVATSISEIWGVRGVRALVVSVREDANGASRFVDAISR